MDIKRKKDKIIFEFPFWTNRFNPYMIDDDGNPEDVGRHETLIGVISYDKCGNTRTGFCNVIDMDYKDKTDQWSDYIIITSHSIKDFIEVCKKLKIKYVDDRNINDVREDCRQYIDNEE